MHILQAIIAPLLVSKCPQKAAILFDYESNISLLQECVRDKSHWLLYQGRNMSSVFKDTLFYLWSESVCVIWLAIWVT